MTMDAFQQFFIKNLKDNLRIFMTFSPFGEKLRDYVRKYPSIIDHTTCLSFTDWPEAALKEVANDDFVVNLRKAIRDGEADGWLETDKEFYRFEPSLSTLLEEYVEANKDVIFD